MSRTATYEAIVLRTIDVGEADRLCIFFTKEAGRIAARLHGARKSGSKSGGALLPFRHVAVDLYINDVGATVRSVKEYGDMEPPHDFHAFIRLERGIELLLALTEDGHPLPDVFDVLCAYICLPAEHSSAGFDLFRLRLLHVLGLLPANDDDTRFRFLANEARTVVEACSLASCDLQVLSESIAIPNAIDGFIQSVTEQSISRPLRSDLVAIGMAI